MGVVPEDAPVVRGEIESGQHRIRDAQAGRVVVTETRGVHRQTSRGGAVLRRSSRTCNDVPYYRVKGESADEFHYFTSLSTPQAGDPHLRGPHGPHRCFGVGTGRGARPCEVWGWERYPDPHVYRRFLLWLLVLAPGRHNWN